MSIDHDRWYYLLYRATTMTPYVGSKKGIETFWNARMRSGRLPRLSSSLSLSLSLSLGQRRVSTARRMQARGDTGMRCRCFEENCIILRVIAREIDRFVSTSPFCRGTFIGRKTRWRIDPDRPIDRENFFDTGNDSETGERTIEKETSREMDKSERKSECIVAVHVALAIGYRKLSSH